MHAEKHSMRRYVLMQAVEDGRGADKLRRGKYLLRAPLMCCQSYRDSTDCDKLLVHMSQHMLATACREVVQAAVTVPPRN